MTEPESRTGRVRPRGTALLLLAIALAALPLVVSLDARPLLPFDEALYCGTTADMAEHQQWLYPTNGGEFYGWYGKPPLVNWLQAASTKAFGWSVFSLRLPTALGMAAFIVLIWLTGTLIGGAPVGLIAGALALVSQHLLDAGRQIWLEDLVGPAFAGAFLCYAIGAGKPRAREALAMLGAGALIGVAILTKQVFGGLGAIALVSVEVVHRKPGALRRVGTAAAACVATAGWWFVATAVEVGRPAWDSWFGYHIVQRATEVLEGHPRGIDAFAGSLQEFMGAVPWAIGALGWIIVGKAVKGDDRKWRAYLAWTALLIVQYLVVGVAVKTFLPWYQIVLTPPVLIGTAFVIVELWKRAEPRWVAWLLPAAVLAYVAAEARLDSIAAMAVVGIAYLLRDRLKLDAVANRAGLGGIVGAAVIVAVVITNPTRRYDWRTQVAARVPDGARVVVIAPDPEQYPWRCHLPRASIYAAPPSCEEVTAMIVGADVAVLEGPTRSCALPSAVETFKTPRSTLVSLAATGRTP